MISTIPTFYAVYFVLMKVIIINVVESESLGVQNNVTNDTSLWTLGRSKRSLIETMPSQLKIKFKYGTDKEIDLNWIIKRFQYLANEHLPVIMPFADVNTYVMENIGEFVLYQDVKKCSAVVYFEKSKTLYGVIGMNYYIEALPFNFDENGEYRLQVVGEPYIRKYEYPFPHIFPEKVLPPPSDTDAWQDYVRESNHNLASSLKRKPDCNPGSSAKRKRTEPHHVGTNEKELTGHLNIAISYQDYFSETLILVARDMVDIFKLQYGNDHYIEWIVKYYLINFNAVDMIYRKLKHKKFEVHINIAKIVIEDELIPFNFMSNDELQFTEIIAKLPNYMNVYASAYSPDSFDHVFISTSRPIYDDSFLINGRTKYGHDLYEARKLGQFYTVVPISIVTFQSFYIDYATAVHEIARTLNIKVDPHENGLTHIGQCHGIMQREGPKCMSCLKWSDESQKQFELFFNGNRNRCFLMNTPRSIRPNGVSRFTSANRQCQCFGYQTSHARHIGNHGCEIPLQCNAKKGAGKCKPEDTVLPFDGTTCANRKVCWEKKCEWLPAEDVFNHKK